LGVKEWFGLVLLRTGKFKITWPEPCVEVDEVKTATDGKHSRRGSFRFFTAVIE
jgi:hypothetical protein